MTESESTKTLIVLVVLLTLFVLFLIHIRRIIERRLRQLRKNPTDRKSDNALRLKRLSSLVTIAFFISFVSLSVDAGFLIDHVMHDGRMSSEQAKQDTVSEPPEPSEVTEIPTLPASDPITRVSELKKGYFKLSAVEGSAMLALSETLILESEEISMDTFKASKVRLTSYLEELCAYGNFLVYHSGLKIAFPKGDRVDYGFEDPKGLEDCLAELRGAGKKLENSVNDTDKKKSALRHMMVRGKDCLYFGKPLWKSGDINGEQMWAFAEITYTSLVNRIVCGGLDNSEQSYFYYVAGQVFQYLTEIADTVELKHRMNYVATIFFSCACDDYISANDNNIRLEYSNNIFFNELKSLYNIAITADDTQRVLFFSEMQWAEENIDPSVSSSKAYSQMRDEIENLKLYTQWRDKNG